MKVKELIEKLQAFNPEFDIVLMEGCEDVGIAEKVLDGSKNSELNNATVYISTNGN